MSSPTYPADSSLFKIIQSMDIIDMKNGRTYLMIHDKVSHLKYKLMIPDLTMEKEISATLHEPPEQYTSKYFTGRKAKAPVYPTIEGFSCYRNVDGSYQTIEHLANTFPTFVEVINIGPSHLKSIGEGGDELKVLKLTNQNKTMSKSPLFILCGVHPRELAPTEACARFAEDMLDQYGKDSDKTWILDYTEIHIVLQVNPDGRRHEEANFGYRRKNMNDFISTPDDDPNSVPNPPNDDCILKQFRSAASCVGVDLNRNFPHAAWGTTNDGPLCSRTYAGPSAGSEMETQAIVNYVESVIPPGTNLVDPVTNAFLSNSKGVLIDVHSYGQDFFWPFGYSSLDSPNEYELKAFAKKMSSYTFPIYSSENFVYATSGDTTDYAYSATGVAAYTAEMGTSFYQSCSYFEEYEKTNAFGFLLYAARVTNAPYVHPKGPDVISMDLSSNTLTPNENLELTVLVSDNHRGSGYSSSFQNIQRIDLFIDKHPYENNATVIAQIEPQTNSMVAIETFEVPLQSYDTGQHIVYIQAHDIEGPGPIYSLFFNVVV